MPRTSGTVGRHAHGRPNPLRVSHCPSASCGRALHEALGAVKHSERRTSRGPVSALERSLGPSEGAMAADPPTLAIARLSRVLENHTATDLSLSQYRVLGLLASGHERAGDLAARLAVTKPTLTALVDGLVDRGYVVREALPGDRRAVRVAITDGGREAAEAAGRGFRAVLDEVLGYCADADAVLAAIDALRPALDARWAASARRRRPTTVSRTPPPATDAAATRPAPAGPGVGWLRRLGPFVARYRGVVIATLALSVIAQVLIGLLPLIQQRILDDSIISQEQPLGPMLVLLLLTGVLGFSTNYMRRYLGAKVSVHLQHDLRLAIHRHLYELDFARHDQLSVGDVMSRSTGDLTLIQAFFFSVPMLVANVTLLVVAVVVMFVLSPLLSVVVVVFVPVFGFLAVRYRDRVFPASWNDQRLAGAVAGVVDEAVTGVRVVKAFAQEQRELDRLTGHAHELYQSRMRTARLNCRYSPTLQVLPMFAQLGVLALGGWLALIGHITLGVFLAFASYLVQIVTPVRLVASLLATTQQARAGAERVFELLDLQPGVRDAPDARPVADARGDSRARPRQLRPRRGAADGARRVAADPPGGAHRHRRGVGVRQVDAGVPDRPLLRPDVGHGPPRRRRRARADAGLAAGDGQRRVRGELPVLDHHPREHRVRPAGGVGRRDRGSGAGRGRPRLRRRPAAPGTTPSSASAATRCRAASASASRSRAPRSPTRRCSCSTTPRPPSTRTRRNASSTASAPSSGLAPPCSSPTAPRRCGWPTAWSCSTAAASSRKGRTPSCGTPRRCTGSCCSGRSSRPRPPPLPSPPSIPTPGRRASPMTAGTSPRSSSPRSCRASRRPVVAASSGWSAPGPASSRHRRSCWRASSHCRRCGVTRTSISPRPRRRTRAPACAGWRAASGGRSPPSARWCSSTPGHRSSGR